jgi:antitoxin VapB
MAGVEFDENGDGLGRSERGDDLAERLLVIGRDCAAHLKESFRTIDHGEMLYDDHGLPRF